MTQANREEFSEISFAILAEDYMILSLRMGYHFTTVESLCTPESGKNYVRMQYKEGGASPERRARRIQLLMNVLSRQGYEHHSKGDFLDSRIAYQDAELMYRRLFDLGRLTILTKQLDMALSNDAIRDWYAKDIMAKLGIDPGGDKTA
jgi:pyruvate,water dikinase